MLSPPGIGLQAVYCSAHARVRSRRHPVLAAGVFPGRLKGALLQAQALPSGGRFLLARY